jgi:hypothetical protein
MAEGALRPSRGSRALAGFEPQHRVLGDVAAAYRVAQDRTQRRERPDDRTRRATLGRERVNQRRDVVDRDRGDLSPPKGREEVAVEVVAVALQRPLAPLADRDHRLERSNQRAATVANVNRGQAASTPTCAAIASRARALRASSRSPSTVRNRGLPLSMKQTAYLPLGCR